MAINQAQYQALVENGMDYAVAAILADPTHPLNPIGAATGPAGPAGVAGAPGATGLPGTAGLAGSPGPGALTPNPQSANATAANGQFVEGTGGAGGITITLPAPTAGTQIVVKKVDAGAGAVTVSSAANIDGAATRVLGAQYASVRLFGDGTTYQTF